MVKNSLRVICFIFLLGMVLFFPSSCSKDSTTSTVVPGTSVTDNEGNVYNTVTIGSQTWMAENLRSIKLNDGTQIPYVVNRTTWSNLTTPAYSYYADDSVTYKAKAGALYNWYTVDTKKLCPTGWRVPSDADWVTLQTYLGTDSLAGGKLKETATYHWYSPNLYATNSTGFTAIPCGYRFYNGSYNNFGFSGNWWSSTSYSTPFAWYRYLSYTSGAIGKNYYDKVYGFSVRCIKN